MSEQADWRPVAHDGARDGARTDGPPVPIRTYARTVAVLVLGLAFTTVVFLHARSLEQRGPHGARGERRAWTAAHAILAGGGGMTLFAAVCCGPLAARSARSGHRRAEEVARASEQSLSEILHSTSIPLFVIDSRHIVTRWNRACENLTGVRADQVIGRRPWSAFYPAQRPVLADLVTDQCLRDEIAALYGNSQESATLPGAYEFEAFFPQLGHGGKWLFCTAAPLRDARGNVIGAIETFQDLTERRRAEEELKKLASVVRHTSELISLAAPDGKLVFLNEAGYRLLGLDPADADQTDILALLPDHLREMGRPEVVPALLARGTWEGDLQYRNRRTGALIDVHTMAFTIQDPATGRPQYLANVSLDITARKQVEGELQRRVAELSEAKRRLEVLVSNTTDRERRMVDLKGEVNDLLHLLGRAPRYQVPQQVAELSGSTLAPAGEEG